MKCKSLLFFCVMSISWTPLLSAQARSKADIEINEAAQVSPARGIIHKTRRGPRRFRSTSVTSGNPYRSIDGTGNNLENPEMGATHTQLLRLVEPAYWDDLSGMAGVHREGPRKISNIVVSQSQDITNRLRATDFLWQWGQFLDHDISLTEGTDPAEPVNIEIPDDDLYFDPNGTIAFNRSVYDHNTGSNNPRQQLNEITAWIDASNVYGSDEDRAMALRTLDGTGRLRTSDGDDGDLLPFNFDGLPNAGGDSPGLFLAGDVRANEQVGLAALHTLFVREHNRLADELAQDHPDWNGDEIYQKARQLVGAEMQVITYREFLPALLGPKALSRYRGYNPEIDARISNIFSTAVYRFGHSALSAKLLRIDADGNPSPYGHLALRDAFFAPQRIIDEGGIEPILRGLAKQACQGVDPYIVDDVRNFLFGDPRGGGFDLAALNIQRGRDHGIPSYNDTREQLGLTRASDFSEVTSDPEMQSRLAQAYKSVDDIDLWVGALAEDHLHRAHVGELIFTVIKAQFEALRDGDRFWYSRVLTKRERRMVERSRLSDIIRRNTDIGAELKNDVFHIAPGHSRRTARASTQR